MLWGMIPPLLREGSYSKDLGGELNTNSAGSDLRRGGRVAEGTGLLNRHRSKACRGFKSRPLRHVEHQELIFLR
jgi:hypothetical protein